MADITLFKPDGMATYSEIKNITIKDGVISFHISRDMTAQVARQITTNLPFLVEQTVGI